LRAQMGLLDDAIREHLEFKRQHGADPDEVSRQEHEALGAVDRGDRDAPAGGDGAGLPEASGRGRELVGAIGAGHESSGQGHDLTGEETAELDMSSVLEDEDLARRQAASAEESLEWEVPGEAREGADGEEGEGSGEVVEDVLEETPDFLRDTPDQDRLWFEQQPPRDFDFDK
jgi:hypothetical protein